MSKSMKKLTVLEYMNLMLVLCVMLFFCMTFDVCASFTYRDKECGVIFTVPDGWKEVTLSKDRQTIDAKFENESGRYIMYGSFDLYDGLTEDDKNLLKRADIDDSTMTMQDISDLTGVPTSKITAETYGGKKYYGYSYDDLKVFTRINNGYIYIFQYTGTYGDSGYKDLEAILSSVIYQNGEIISRGDMAVLSIFLSIIITIAIYSLPIIIYRYLIIKTPIDNKKARRIVIIYAIIAFVIMSAVKMALTGEAASSGGAIIIWSYINYKILTHNKHNTENVEYDYVYEKADIEEKNDLVDESSFENDDSNFTSQNTYTSDTKETSTDDIDTKTHTSIQLGKGKLFCRKCGAKIPTDSDFCFKCGTKVIR